MGHDRGHVDRHPHDRLSRISGVRFASRTVHARAFPLQSPYSTCSLGRRARRSPPQAGPAAPVRGRRIRPPRRARSLPGWPIERRLAGAYRGGTDRGPLPPCLVDHQLHSIRRREALRKAQLNQARLYSLRQTLRSIRHIMLESTCAAVCTENPDLVRVVEDDGTVLLGRVAGFEGAFLEGTGRVEAEAGTLRLHELTPGLDGSVVLRYHSVPYLRARPAVAIDQEYREDDPVPFIRLRPTPG